MEVKCDLKPMCDKCPEFVLDATVDSMDLCHGDSCCYVKIGCANREFCDRIERYITKTISQRTEDQLTIPNVFDKGAYDQK